MSARPRGRVRTDEQTIRLVVGALGVFHLLLGGWQLFGPGSFFEHIGRYGAENTHYVGDAGSFTFALGIAFLLSAPRPSWRPPMLTVAALWYAVHALNHLFDIGENRISDARGAFDTILLALGAILLAWLAGRSGGRGAEVAR